MTPTALQRIKEIESSPQADTRFYFWRIIGSKISRKIWPITSNIAWWIHGFVQHCDSPEYFTAHPKLVRWTGGLKIACWTHVCGHGILESLQSGNIYWKIWKSK